MRSSLAIQATSGIISCSSSSIPQPMQEAPSRPAQLTIHDYLTSPNQRSLVLLPPSGQQVVQVWKCHVIYRKQPCFPLSDWQMPSLTTFSAAWLPLFTFCSYFNSNGLYHTCKCFCNCFPRLFWPRVISCWLMERWAVWERSCPPLFAVRKSRFHCHEFIAICVLRACSIRLGQLFTQFTLIYRVCKESAQIARFHTLDLCD